MLFKGHLKRDIHFETVFMIIWATKCILVPLFYDLTTFLDSGQKFVKFFVGFLENLRHQKGILRLTDLYI